MHVQAESWACGNGVSRLESTRLESASSAGVSIGALCDVCLPVDVHAHVENFGTEALPVLDASPDQRLQSSRVGGSPSGPHGAAAHGARRQVSHAGSLRMGSAQL